MSSNNNELIISNIEWDVVNINTIAKPLGNNYYISSWPFSSKDYPTISWKMNVFLNGYQGGTYGSVNVSLRQIGLKGNDSVNASFSFYAIQNNGLRMDIGNSNKEFKYWTESSKFNVNMQSLLQLNGSIILGCDVKFLLKDINLEYIKKDESAIYSKSLLLNMWEQKEFMDCIIEIDGESINAHKSVLAQNSCVFRKMFEESNGMIEARNGIVKIDDCSVESFRALLEYCYTGIVSDETLKNLSEDLFVVSHKYEINLLKEKCENYMASIIDLNKISIYCHLIELYNSKILEKACVNFIKLNKDNFFAGDIWKNLKCSYVSLTQRLMEQVIMAK